MNQTSVPIYFHTQCNLTTGECYGRSFEVPAEMPVIIEQTAQHGNRLLIRTIWPPAWAWVSPEQITEMEAA